MSLTEWADDLADTLNNSGHGMEQITLASVEDPKSGELVLDTARRTAARYCFWMSLRRSSGRWGASVSGMALMCAETKRPLRGG